jgi:hypothetical protein
MHTNLMRVILTGLVLLWGGCAAETRLDPAPTVKTIDTLAAVKTVHDVRVTADADAWPGIPAVVEHVTPVKVTIENGTTATLQIRYDLFALRGSAGSRYAALPPFQIEGGANALAVTGSYPDYLPPRLYRRGFRVAYPYGSIYPGWPINRHSYYFDPAYYKRYYRYWETVALPTREMPSEALVEGEIDPGGVVAGFIYFEPDDTVAETGVTFSLDLVRADDAAALGSVAIPFVIDN